MLLCTLSFTLKIPLLSLLFHNVARLFSRLLSLGVGKTRIHREVLPPFRKAKRAEGRGKTRAIAAHDDYCGDPRFWPLPRRCVPITHILHDQKHKNLIGLPELLSFVEVSSWFFKGTKTCSYPERSANFTIPSSFLYYYKQVLANPHFTIWFYFITIVVYRMASSSDIFRHRPN